MWIKSELTSELLRLNFAFTIISSLREVILSKNQALPRPQVVSLSSLVREDEETHKPSGVSNTL